LWGAPPGVLEQKIAEEDDDSEQVLLNDGIDFRNIYSLWGSNVPLGIKTLDEEEKTPLIPSMEGLSQLWNENIPPYEEEELVDSQDDSIEERVIDFQAYAGLEWWDEVSEDWKELRLSQILADEEYEEAMDVEAAIPMTFERFAEETEKLIEQAEVERKETEAIMKAPPNAAFLDAVEDSPMASVVEDTVVSSDKFEEMILSLSEETRLGDDSDANDDLLGGDDTMSNSVSPISDAYQQIADVTLIGDVEPLMKGDSD
jgi:hypothetical protein